MFDPCECCGKTDLDTGHGLCGFGFMCPPCLTDVLEGTESTDAAHAERHASDVRNPRSFEEARAFADAGFGDR